MRKQLLLLSSLFIITCSYASVEQEPKQQVVQESADAVKIHRVALGETMVIIAKKYMVLPQDIYELNPSAAEGLSAGMALRIPVGKKVKVEAEQKNLDYEVVDAATILKDKKKKQAETPVYIAETNDKRTDDSGTGDKQNMPIQTYAEAPVQNVGHEVMPGETLTALARKYNTTIAAITAANEKALKKGLQAGQKLVIPSNGGGTTDAVESVAGTVAVSEEENTGLHHVKQGETLHSLARKYNTTVAEITAANEKLLKRGLQAGQTLTIPGGADTTETAVAVTEPVVVPNHASYDDEPTGNAEHKVEQGETLHGLARKYNTTVEAITAANKAKLKKGLQAGQLIKIPLPTGLAVNVNQQ